MTRRNPKAKWTLPDNLYPVGRKCFMLSVPDDPFYIAAYRGAILELASAYNWADDEAHTAKDAALVMKECIESGDTCVDFRQDDCGLYLIQNGVETLIYDGQLCINANIDNGTLSKSNSGYLGVPTPGNCHIYQVALKPGDTFVLPNLVNTGDTILLGNWQGGTTDWGLLEAFWICPSGTAYALGQCSDTVRSSTLYGTDPLQTAPHLSVIAQIGNTYYDIWNSTSGITPATFTVPGGIVNQPIRLMLNIGSGVSLTASGDVWGEVTICAVQSWCHQWDFSTGNAQGWTLRYNTLLNSNGFSDTDGSAPDGVYIDIGGLPSYTCNHVEIEFISAWGGSSPRVYCANVQNPQSYNANSGTSGVTVVSIPVAMTGNALAIAADRYTGGQQYFGTQRIQKVRLIGSGTNPFGSNNCT